MGDVLDLIGVTVVREGATLLEDLTWTVREGERWVILGPNGAGKTTLLQIAGARMHPTRGAVDVLGDRLGEVDVFELRPRIGLSSAAFAEILPAGEKVSDVVLTAAYAVAGRWRERYDELDPPPSGALPPAVGGAWRGVRGAPPPAPPALGAGGGGGRGGGAGGPLPQAGPGARAPRRAG